MLKCENFMLELETLIVLKCENFMLELKRKLLSFTLEFWLKCLIVLEGFVKSPFEPKFKCKRKKLRLELETLQVCTT